MSSRLNRSSPDQLAERFVAIIRLVRLDAKRSDRGLSSARYEFLHSLLHSGPGRMGVVAERLGVSARTLTPMVDAVEGDGLVARVPDPSDRRAQMLQLTSAGYEVIKATRRDRLAQVAHLFDGLDPAEQATFDQLLSKILATATGDASTGDEAAEDRSEHRAEAEKRPKNR